MSGGLRGPVPDVDEVADYAEELQKEHPEGVLDVFSEHGGVYVTCTRCGRQWSAHQSTGVSKIVFEVVSEGDNFCSNDPREE